MRRLGRMSKTVHDFYVDKYRNELAQGTGVTDALSNTIPGFPEITGLALDIELQSSNSRPFYVFPATAEHELAIDQRDGIGHTRHHQFLERCGHFDESDA